MSEVSTAIIPIAGLGTRFLPLSKVVSKELWPLVDKPVLQYIIAEAKASGIKHIVFVISPGKKAVLDYFKSSPKIEKILKERKKDSLLNELKELESLSTGLTFSFVMQKNPLGDGHAVLQASKIIGDEPCAALWADDVVSDCDVPCLLQLSKVFKTCQKPVISLYKLPPERLPSYGVVEVEKIANRLYKIKKIVEKPPLGQAPSNFAIVGKYILTPEVFEYLKKAKPSDRGEIILGEVFETMLEEGKLIYGYEFEGKWLECGDKIGWLKSNLYLALKHPKFGNTLKQYLKEIN